VRLNHVLHERVVVLTITTDRVPRCDEENRLEIQPLPNDFFRVIAHFGFMEMPTMQAITEAATRCAFHLETEQTAYFLSGHSLTPTSGKGLPRWREGAFIFMCRNAQKNSEFLRMPSDRTIEIDWPVEI
jgi:KUP system potassium uptake protein